MNHPGEPITRQQFIDGLRELADYLATHPTIPVPRYGDTIHVSLPKPEDGGRFQVSAIAAVLGVPVRDETRVDGHYYAEKAFGPVIYQAVSITEARMAQHYALYSYAGCVTPNTPPTP